MIYFRPAPDLGVGWLAHQKGQKVRRPGSLQPAVLSPTGIVPAAITDSVFVGHPYFDELRDRPLDAGFLAEQRAQSGELLAILPGSRTQELVRNLPDMVRAANKLASVRPGVHFRNRLLLPAPPGTGPGNRCERDRQGRCFPRTGKS